MRCPEACQMAQTPTSGFVQSSGQDYLLHGMKRTLESFKNPGLLAPCFQTNPKIWVCLENKVPCVPQSYRTIWWFIKIFAGKTVSVGHTAYAIFIHVRTLSCLVMFTKIWKHQLWRRSQDRFEPSAALIIQNKDDLETQRQDMT